MPLRILIPVLVCVSIFAIAFRIRKSYPGLSWFLMVLATGMLVLLAGGFFGFIHAF